MAARIRLWQNRPGSNPRRLASRIVRRRQDQWRPPTRLTGHPTAPRVAIEDTGQQRGRTIFAARAFAMPIAMRGHPALFNRPGVERLIAKCSRKFARVERDIPCPRRNRSGFDPRTTH